MRDLVPARAADSHKGDFGRVLVDRRVARPHRRRASGGDRRAALGRRTRHDRHSALVCAGDCRDGAGVHDRAARRDADRARSTMRALDRVLDIKADVIAVGPGLGQSPGTAAFVQGLLERAGVPLVLDADALNAFAGEPDRLMGRDGVDVIITPHPGEMARLLSISVEAVQHDRLQHATEFAAAHRAPRRAQGASHGHRRPRESRLRQPDRQLRDGDRRHRRPPHGMIAAWFAPAARRRSGVQARGLPARHRRRSRRSRRRGSRAHRRRRRLAPRRCACWS